MLEEALALVGLSNEQPNAEGSRTRFLRVGRASFIRLLAPLCRQFFHPPSETNLPNRSRAYYDDGDEDPEARALAKFVREAARRTEEGRQNLRRPVAWIRQLIE